MTHLRLVAAAATAALLTSAVGHAQPPAAQPEVADPSTAETAAADAGAEAPDAPQPAPGDSVAYETAKELYDAARDARAAEDWKRCQVKATAAWGVFQARAPLAALLGECELQLGEHVAAARHLALSLSFDDLNPQLRDHTAQLLDEAKQHVAVLDVSVDGAGADAPGITLLIDGKTAEAFPLYLAPGSHTLEARHAERGEATQRLTLEGGTEGKVNLTLKVGGGGNGDPGNGDTVDEGLPYWPGFVLGGVGLIGVGVGVGLMVAAGGKADSAADDLTALEAQYGDNPCRESGAAAGSTQCTQIADANSSSDTLHNAGIASLIAGIGVAAVSAVWLGVAYSGDTDTAAQAAITTVPWLVPSDAGSAGGLLLRGRF